MFRVFGLPPSVLRLIRIRSKVDSRFFEIPIEMPFFLNITVTMVRTDILPNNREIRIYLYVHFRFRGGLEEEKKEREQLQKEKAEKDQRNWDGMG